MPVPESNGEEWDRLEPASALDALVELVLHGEYNGLQSDKRLEEGLELRGAAVAVFEVSRCQFFNSPMFMILNESQNFIRTGEIRQAIVQAMLPAQGAFRIIFCPRLLTLSILRCICCATRYPSFACTYITPERTTQPCICSIDPSCNSAFFSLAPFFSAR